jgi:hypothetical protein
MITNRGWRAFALVLLLVILSGAAMAVVLATAGAHPWGDAVIRIDGDRITLAELGMRPAAAFLAGCIVAVVGLVVVPIAVCLPLLAVGGALLVALLAIAGAAVLVFSPLLLLGWLAWRLARPATPAS